jgi:hypothetical protein
MAYTDLLDTYGIPANPAARGELREMLAQEIERERSGGSGEEMLRTLCVQLFSIGIAEDSLLIWRAKSSSFDAGCGLDVQFLCGAGLATTKEYLAKSPAPDAEAALRHIEKCEQSGDFSDWEPAASIADYRRYFSLTDSD